MYVMYVCLYVQHQITVPHTVTGISKKGKSHSNMQKENLNVNTTVTGIMGMHGTGGVRYLNNSLNNMALNFNSVDNMKAHTTSTGNFDLKKRVAYATSGNRANNTVTPENTGRRLELAN